MRILELCVNMRHRPGVSDAEIMIEAKEPGHVLPPRGGPYVGPCLTGV